MEKIRASEAPMVVLCSQSRLGDIDMDEDHEAGRLGTACHEYMAKHVLGEKPPELEQLCLENRIEGEEKELGMLVAYGRIAWGDMKSKFPQPVVEQTLEAQLTDDVLLTGHPDVISLQSNHVRILDWKSGRVRRDHWLQLTSYAILACRALGVPSAKITTVWLRDGETETHTITPKQLDSAEQSLLYAINTNRRYNTGDHCRFCPRFGECDAVKQLVRGAIEAAGQGFEDGDMRKNADSLHVVFDGLACAEKHNKNMRRIVRQEIEIGGEIIMGDGDTLFLKPKRRRNLVEPLIFGPILKGHMTQPELAVCMTKGVTEVINAVKRNAEKGQKGKRAAEVMEKLESAGCIDETHYFELARK